MVKIFFVVQFSEDPVFWSIHHTNNLPIRKNVRIIPQKNYSIEEPEYKKMLYWICPSIPNDVCVGQA